MDAKYGTQHSVQINSSTLTAEKIRESINQAMKNDPILWRRMNPYSFWKVLDPKLVELKKSRLGKEIL